MYAFFSFFTKHIIVGLLFINMRPPITVQLFSLCLIHIPKAKCSGGKNPHMYIITQLNVMQALLQLGQVEVQRERAKHVACFV